MSFRKWQPSKTAKHEFAQTMQKIDDFCSKNGIEQSKNSDSYYFSIGGQKYRVSNHTIESSNNKAFNFLGEQVRNLYHDPERKNDIIYIHAGKN